MADKRQRSSAPGAFRKDKPRTAKAQRAPGHTPTVVILKTENNHVGESVNQVGTSDAAGRNGGRHSRGGRRRALPQEDKRRVAKRPSNSTLILVREYSQQHAPTAQVRRQLRTLSADDWSHRGSVHTMGYLLLSHDGESSAKARDAVDET